MTITAPEPGLPPEEALALAHAQQQAAIRAVVLQQVLAVWQGAPLSVDSLLDWWFSGPRDEVYTLTAIGQELMASEASNYVRDSLALQGYRTDTAEVNAVNFAGISSDGTDLYGLLDTVPLAAWRHEVLEEKDRARARAEAEYLLRRILFQQVTDAGREADQVAIVGTDVVGTLTPTEQQTYVPLTAMPPLETRVLAPPPAPNRRVRDERLAERKRANRSPIGWIRVLTPPSCGRCALLAGKWYGWNEGFARHDNCFPAGVVASGPPIEAATRRWYEGELVVIRTASGKKLPATANHPVLTDRGWVPAKFLAPGDYVVSDLGAKSAKAGVAPREHQAPALVEDLWRAPGMVGLAPVPPSPEDFHGDGGYGQVDVVAPDRLLRHRGEPALAQPGAEASLGWRAVPAPLLAGQRGLSQALLAPGAPPDRRVRRGDLGLPLLEREPRGAQQAGLGSPSQGDLSRLQVSTDDVATHAVTLRQRVLTLAAGVLGGEGNLVQRDVAPRWDAPAGPLTMESRGAYASRGQDLLLRLASQVELDRVVEVSRAEWSGHVYNLTSSEGWFSANGIVASNCDCRHVPALEADAGTLITDPRAYFDSLPPEEQERLFGQANAKAIREGADIGQVINAGTFGVYTVDGRQFTNLGRTSRGHYGRETPAGRAKIVRLTPLQIYREAGEDREEARRLLRRFGYLL